jgi:hypothetical protein
MCCTSALVYVGVGEFVDVARQRVCYISADVASSARERISACVTHPARVARGPGPRMAPALQRTRRRCFASMVVRL